MPDVAFQSTFRLDIGPLHYFSVLGRALFTAQHFEMNCRAIVAFLDARCCASDHGPSALDDAVFDRKMLQLWKKTLGHHTCTLKELCVVSEDGATLLDAARKARNEIAHEVAMDVTDRLDAELSQRIDHIRDLVWRIAAADKIVSFVLHVLNRDPLPGREFLQSYEAKVAEWVVEDTIR